MNLRKFLILALTGFVAQMVAAQNQKTASAGKNPVKYPAKTELTLPVLEIKGEIHSPTELYFQRRPEENLGSLVERRKDFHPQMLRDITVSK